MKLTVLYDNEILHGGKDLTSDWGFSCLLETKVETILFDTGAKGSILIGNMRALSVDPHRISKVVISHEHIDHAGGLHELADQLDQAVVYRLRQSRRPVMKEEIVTEGIQVISEGILSSGKLKQGNTPEQSLFLEGKDGWYVLTGCSHPGVMNIMVSAREVGSVMGLIGGLHGFDDLDILSELSVICPAHCTTMKEEILKAYPDLAIRCGVGRTIWI